MFEDEYASKELIPKGYEYLYIQSGDKFVLKTATQVKSESDVKNTQEALRKEREAHSVTKAENKKWEGLDPDETRSKLDSIPALEAAAKTGGDNKEIIEEQVKTRVDAAVAPLNRKIETLESTNSELETSVVEYKTANTNRTIDDAIRDAAIDGKLHAGGMSDALQRKGLFEVIENADGTTSVVTKSDVGVTPGLQPSEWLSDVKETSSHWWPKSEGGGSRGSDASSGGSDTNPFTHANWNTTAQGKMLTADRVKAEKMAESAGTTIGGAKPPAPTT